MTLSAIDLMLAADGIRGRRIRGEGSPPLSGAERTALYRLRRRGKLPPYQWLDRELAANGYRDPDTGCLVWMGARNGKGYGKVRRGGRAFYVHRLALAAKLGRSIAPGMHACHSCANPACFEPDHLTEGAALDNIAERWDRWYATHSPTRP